MGTVRKAKLSEIRPNAVALRSVNAESDSYLGLVDSIKEKGFMGAITVRESTDDETGKKFLELVDGLHRFSAAKDVGIEEINVDICDFDADEVLEAQILSNIHHVETKPIEYTRQMLRILARHPLMTEAELAKKLARSITWVQQRLSLTKIADDKIRQLVDDGEINLMNAYQLAKLPVDEQANFVDRAMTENPETFVPAVKQRVKELKEAARQGKDAAEATFSPVAHMQKMKDIKAALEDGKLVPALVKKHKITDPVKAANFALRWALHLDPDSLAVQEAEWQEKKDNREAKKKDRELARTQKRAADAKKKSDDAAKVAAEASEKAGQKTEDAPKTEPTSRPKA